MRGNIAEHDTHRAETSSEPARSPQPIGNQDVASGPTHDGRDNGLIAASRRGYGTYRSIGLDLVLAFVGQLLLAFPLLGLALALFVLTSHTLALDPGRRAFDAWLTTPQATLAGLLATDGAMLLVLWLRLRRLRLGWSVVGLGAGLRTGASRAVLVGLGMGVVGLTLSAVLGTALQALGLDQSVQEKTLIAPLTHAPFWEVLAVVVAGTLVAPVVEEIFFRGYVFHAIAVRKDVRVAYLVSATAFAAFHQLPTLMPVLFVVGLLFCVVYQRTGHVLASITAHAINNGVAFALTLLPAASPV
jgi:membrane protease YdiL (CAAX protease family)